MKLKNIIMATRLPFVTASTIPVILSIVWCAAMAGKFHFGSALLCIVGVILIHIGANTMNDFFDWNFSDLYNPHAGPFNGGSRSKVGDTVPRKQFLVISLVCLALLVLIALTFIIAGRFHVLYFSLAGLFLGYLYSIPPFRLHSRGLGEICIFLAFGPVLTAAVCYVMTGFVRSEHFLIGIPAGLSTVAILWINQFPDYDADKSAGKKTLTVRLGLKASRYLYLLLILAVYLSTAFLIFDNVFAVWAGLIIILLPGSLKAMRTLFKNYRNPPALVSVQGFTIQFQMLTGLLITIGLSVGHWVYF
jgi:1,4-dihydroxy-2-naphthoate polyprenyltransferase